MLFDETTGIEIPPKFQELINQGSDEFLAKGNDEDISLDKFTVEAFIYHDEGTASGGVLKALFSGALEGVSSGVIQEAKRFTTKEVDGKSVEIGVAVRLAVATNAAKLEANLSPENLAAAAQLGMAETRVMIKVAGYLGHIADRPTVTGLNVTNYQEYLDAFNNIQNTVFDNPDDWKPTILGWK